MPDEHKSHMDHGDRQILKAIREAKEEILASNHHHTQELKSLLRQELEQVFAELKRIKTPRITFIIAGQSIHIPGLKEFQGDDMSTYSGIPRDHQDEPFTLDPIVIADSEGAVDVPFTETLESDNPAVVSIVGDPSNQSFSFGTFGTATVSRKVTFTPPGQAELTVNAGTATFNITPGALTVTGNINVPGLTPDA